MGSIYFEEKVYQAFQEIISACDLILLWNEKTHCYDDYLISPEVMKNLAASCMMIESIGENIKNIDRLMPDYLETAYPDIPWKELKGIRDQIAHKYFRIDAEIVFDFVSNVILPLKETCKSIIDVK